MELKMPWDVKGMLQMAASPVQPDDLLDQETFAGLCKALGHPARVKIVTYLDQVEGCICGKIVDMLPLAQSTVSQHLKQLKKAGLITWNDELDGWETNYCAVCDLCISQGV